jgi:hypothetical protein
VRVASVVRGALASKGRANLWLGVDAEGARVRTLCGYVWRASRILHDQTRHVPDLERRYERRPRLGRRVSINDLSALPDYHRRDNFGSDRDNARPRCFGCVAARPVAAFGVPLNGARSATR